MKETKSVIFARVYTTESANLINQIIHFLTEEAKIKGVTVFRAIRGVGTTGTHTASLVDLSLDLPLVIEFFDNEAVMQPILDTLSQWVKPSHLVFWHANTN